MDDKHIGKRYKEAAATSIVVIHSLSMQSCSQVWF